MRKRFVSTRARRPFLFASVIAVVLAAAMTLFVSSTAYAHAALISANPGNNETLRRPPARVVLRFSEAIERKLTQIHVLDKDKQRVDTGDIAFDDNDPAFASVGVKDLSPGLYFVRWSNVSAIDGHNLSGEYPFIVLNADGSFPAGVSLTSASAQTSGGSLLPKNADVTLKWIALLSLGTVAGAAFFLFAVLRPAAAFLEYDDYERATDVAERWLVNLAHVLLPAAFIASAFLVLLTVHRFQTSTGLWAYLTTLRVGQYRLAQLLLIIAALAGADLLFLGTSAPKRHAGIGVLMLASAGALLTNSLVSHSATGRGEFWAVSSDYLHLIASTAWLGALVMVFVFLRWRRIGLFEAQRLLLMANVFDRFSVVATLSVITILATGTFNGLVAIPNAGAMIHTTYGKVLLAKLSLLAPLLAVAGLNAYYLKPRLVALIDGLHQQGGRGLESERTAWQRQFTRLQRVLPPTIAVEIALVFAVFAAVGVLTQTTTAKGEEASRNAQAAGATKFAQSAQANDLKLDLQVSPNRVGLNEYDLLIENSDGGPSTTVTQARLRFNYQDVANAVAPSEISLSKFAPGEYKGAGAYFTEPGNWRVDATIRRSNADDVSRAFVLPVGRAPATATARGGGMFALPFTVFNWNEVAGAFLALAGAVIFIYRRELGGLTRWGRRASLLAATVALLAGAVFVFGVHTHGTAANPTAGNPVKPTQASVARGNMLFQQNCVVCHGIDGRGDGPQAAKLDPAPTDFRLHMPLHTDPQFFGFIADGYPGSAMPAFRASFLDQDIWNLVNFLRSAFTEAPSQ